MFTLTPEAARRGIDFIGDIHGHADALRRLLTKLGYASVVGGGYRHPSRRVVFLGDFVDRGPEIPETVRIARAMHQSGDALAVMGNHEYNMLCYHTERDGRPLREHSEKNSHQHAATLKQYANRGTELREHLSWFMTLPLFLEGEAVVVHACPEPKSMERVRTLLGPGAVMTEEFLLRSARDGPEQDAVEILLKGQEARLPGKLSFRDKDGHKRTKMRTRWWLDPAELDTATYLDAGIFGGALNDADRQGLALPLDPETRASFFGYDSSRPPVFFGHYWWLLQEPGPPDPVRANVACLDFSVAFEKHLMAYRWDGEAQLDSGKYRWVPAIGQAGGQ